MANPFLGAQSLHTPSHVDDHYGDDMHFPTAPYHVAAFLVFALALLVILKVSGFRAVVGLGRG